MICYKLLKSFNSKFSCCFTFKIIYTTSQFKSYIQFFFAHAYYTILKLLHWCFFLYTTLHKDLYFQISVCTRCGCKLDSWSLCSSLKRKNTYCDRLYKHVVYDLIIIERFLCTPGPQTKLFKHFFFYLLFYFKKQY